MQALTGSRENRHTPTYDQIGAGDAKGVGISESVARARQQNASAAFGQAAVQLETIASEDAHTVALLNQVDSIPYEKTRSAAYQALGFDEKVAVGLAWRKEAGLPRFDSQGVANVRIRFGPGQYGPRLQEVKETLLNRAEALREHAKAIDQWSRMSPAARHNISRLIEKGMLGASFSADALGIASFFKSSTSSLIGGASVAGAAFTTMSMMKTEGDWTAAKLVALTPAMTLTDLERARVGYMNGFGKGLVQLMLMGLPATTIGCEILDTIAGEPDAPRLPSCGLSDMLAAASGHNASTLREGR